MSTKPLKGFILDAVSDHYWYPVTVDLIGEDGKTQKFEFDAKFKRLTAEQQRDIFSPPDGGSVPNDNEILDLVFLGWRKVYLSNGEEVPVNDENRATLLSIPPTPARITLAWMKSIGIEGKAKN